MDKVIVGKLLPNIKVSLGDESVPTEIEDGEISDDSDPSKINRDINEPKNGANIVRTCMETTQPRVYENQFGGFVTGLDLSSEVLRKKLEERAERFGLEKTETHPITQDEIDALYKSFDNDPENMDACKLKNMRLDALHMRGVDEMNTNEIFKYFEDYGPASVEWINDFSCNVVWLDEVTTARAMIGLSRPLIVKGKSTIKQDSSDFFSEAGSKKSSETATAIEMTDSEESGDDETLNTETAMEVDIDESSPNDNKSSNSESLSQEDEQFPNVPVPPGHWRLGLPHPKAKAILLRFASKDDKKLPGAEKRSQYYQKYGNPNYGGLKGLISTSRKRKIHAAQNRQIVEQLTDTSKTDSGSLVKTSVVPDRKINLSRVKMPRMKMYADEEEEKQRRAVRRSNVYPKSYPGSIHSRLGTKYTRDDLCQLGPRFSSGSDDEEDDNIPINCTVPSRYNIWTDIAMSMSEEDRSIPRRSKQSYYRPYEDYKSSQDLRSSLGSRSSSSYKPYERSERREGQSRNRSSYLKSAFGSSFSQRIQSSSEDENDLRSRIKKIKHEDKGRKHRSPLCKDD